jgi:hypothetical protein
MYFIFKDKKSKRSHNAVGIKVFLTFFCLVIEGSRSGFGAGSGSIPLSDGYGSGHRSPETCGSGGSATLLLSLNLPCRIARLKMTPVDAWQKRNRKIKERKLPPFNLPRQEFQIRLLPPSQKGRSGNLAKPKGGGGGGSKGAGFVVIGKCQVMRILIRFVGPDQQLKVTTVVM